MGESRKIKDYKKRILSRVIPVLQGTPYMFGGNGSIPGEPFDCFGMVVEYCRLRYGRNILEVDKDKGYDFFFYDEFGPSFEGVLMERFKEYLDDVFTNVNLLYKLGGDILWTEADGIGSVGIYIGDRQMLITSPSTNCYIISTEYYDIKAVYRWHK